MFNKFGYSTFLAIHDLYMNQLEVIKQLKLPIEIYPKLKTKITKSEITI